MLASMPTPSTIAWWRNLHKMCKDRDITEQIYNSAIIIQSKIDRLRFCNNFIVAQLIFFVIFVFAVAQIGSIVSNHAQIPKHRA